MYWRDVSVDKMIAAPTWGLEFISPIPTHKKPGASVHVSNTTTGELETYRSPGLGG